MLKALQRLGFVDRRRDARDGRCVRVRLTPRGFVSVRMALEMTIVNSEADLTAARGVTGDTRIESTSDEETADTIANAREKVDQIGHLLRAMRKAFADPAPFPVPWRT